MTNAPWQGEPTQESQCGGNYQQRGAKHIGRDEQHITKADAGKPDHRESGKEAAGEADGFRAGFISQRLS